MPVEAQSFINSNLTFYFCLHILSWKHCWGTWSRKLMESVCVCVCVCVCVAYWPFLNLISDGFSLSICSFHSKIWPIWSLSGFGALLEILGGVVVDISSSHPIRSERDPRLCLLLPPLSCNGSGSGAPAAFALEMTWTYPVWFAYRIIFCFRWKWHTAQCEWASKGDWDWAWAAAPAFPGLFCWSFVRVDALLLFSGVEQRWVIDIIHRSSVFTTMAAALGTNARREQVTELD